MPWPECKESWVSRLRGSWSKHFQKRKIVQRTHSLPKKWKWAEFKLSYFSVSAVSHTAKKNLPLVLRSGGSFDFPWNDKSRHNNDLLTWTSHNRSGNRRQRWDVGDLEMGFYPPYARNPAQRLSDLNSEFWNYLCDHVLSVNGPASPGRRLGSSWRWPSTKEAPRSTPPLLDWG